MIRRKLFAYTVMMAAGIAAGFFMMERCELAAGGGFMVGMAVIALKLPLDEPRVRGTAWHRDGAVARGTVERQAEFRDGGIAKGIGNSEDKSTRRDSAEGLGAGQSKRAAEKERLILIGALIAGFGLFTASFILFSNGISAPTRRQAEVPAAVSSIRGRCMYVKSKGEGWRLLVKKPAGTTYQGEEVRFRCDVLVNYYGEISDPADMTGRIVEVSGKLTEPASRDNPGCFDYRLYLRSTGTGYVMKAEYACDSGDRGSLPVELRWALRRRMMRSREDFLARFKDEEIRAFIKGVIFGDKSDIDEDTVEEFNINATGHILAVSGLHVGFLYSLLRIVTGRRKNRAAAAAVIGVLLMYGEMTLWSASVTRAVIVMSISLMAVPLRRPFDLLTSVSAAAAALLITNPYGLFNTGFQMSFAALLGIAFLAPTLTMLMGEGLAVMFAVQLTAAPLTAFVFHRLNPLSIFINIPVIFIASVMVPLSLVMLLISMTGGLIPEIRAGYLVTEGLAELTVRLNSLLASDGIFSGQVTAVNAGLVAGFYLVLLPASSEWMRIRVLRRDRAGIRRGILCAVAAAILTGIAAFNPYLDDGIVFVAVGQGDCTHIREGGHDVLIDGGGSARYNVGEKVLMPYLLSNGADNVDMALVTHLHTDHYKGISELDEVYPVGCIGIPEDYRVSIEAVRTGEKDIAGSGYESRESVTLPSEIRYISMNDRIYLTDDVFIDPIWPPPGRHAGLSLDDPNENNMVYMVNYKGIRVMVTGDLLAEDEAEMLEYYHGRNDLRCDVLKVGHHGSKTSSSEAFLDAALPEIAVIQVGRDNMYGHPHQQTLDRMEERGIKVYRTDLNGAVGLDIRRGRICRVDILKGA